MNIFLTEKHEKDCRFCDNSGFMNSVNEEDGFCIDCYRGIIKLFHQMKQMEIEDLQRRQKEETRQIRLSWKALIDYTESNGTYKQKQNEDEESKHYLDDCVLCDMPIEDGYGVACSSEHCDAVYCEKCQHEQMGLEEMKCGDYLCKSGCCGYHVRTCQCRDTLFW